MKKKDVTIVRRNTKHGTVRYFMRSLAIPREARAVWEFPWYQSAVEFFDKPRLGRYLPEKIPWFWKFLLGIPATGSRMQAI